MATAGIAFNICRKRHGIRKKGEAALHRLHEASKDAGASLTSPLGTDSGASVFPINRLVLFEWLLRKFMRVDGSLAAWKDVINADDDWLRQLGVVLKGTAGEEAECVAFAKHILNQLLETPSEAGRFWNALARLTKAVVLSLEKLREVPLCPAMPADPVKAVLQLTPEQYLGVLRVVKADFRSSEDFRQQAFRQWNTRMASFFALCGRTEIACTNVQIPSSIPKLCSAVHDPTQPCRCNPVWTLAALDIVAGTPEERALAARNRRKKGEPDETRNLCPPLTIGIFVLEQALLWCRAVELLVQQEELTVDQQQECLECAQLAFIRVMTTLQPRRPSEVTGYTDADFKLVLGHGVQVW